RQVLIVEAAGAAMMPYRNPRKRDHEERADDEPHEPEDQRRGAPHAGGHVAQVRARVGAGARGGRLGGGAAQRLETGRRLGENDRARPDLAALFEVLQELLPGYLGIRGLNQPDLSDPLDPVRARGRDIDGTARGDRSPPLEHTELLARGVEYV